MILIKTDSEIIKMRDACAVAADVLRGMAESVVVGMSTYDLDCIGRDLMAVAGAKSASYNYRGRSKVNYPAYSCISLNDEVVHGMPSKSAIIQDGDIVSIDVALFYNGFVGDNTRTIIVGEVPADVKKFVERTQKALFAGIEKAVAGNRVGDISHAIESVAKKYNYGILREFVGHGVGKDMHEEPQVPNFGRVGTGPLLKPGMTLAIEPMFTMGKDDVYVADDGWTVKTSDGSMSAHWEHTVLITNSLPEVLTLAKK